MSGNKIMGPSAQLHEQFVAKQQHSTSNQQYTCNENTGGIGNVYPSVSFFTPCDHPGQIIR